MRARPIPPRHRRLLASSLMCLMAASLGPGARTARAIALEVAISEIYGGGGNSGSTYTHDFIELYNLSADPVDLSGWSVQYASATGTSWQVTSLSGIIPAGGYYLIQEAQG